MQVSLETAYREACLALGEALVRERLLMQALAEAEKPTQQPGSDPA